MKLNFEFEPQITEEYLLHYLTEETIFCYYMGISKIVKGKLFNSIVRDDKKPTCGFFRKARLYLKDFATGDCYDCFGLVSRLYKCSYYSALRQIAIDFNLLNSASKDKIQIVPKFKDKGRSKIQIEMQDFSNEQLDWWKQFGITKAILDKYRVFSCKSVFINDNLSAQCTKKCNIYGYYMGKEKNIELWRIYFPDRSSYRFFSNTPASLVQGYDQLPEKGKALVITKSMKDCMTLSSLGIAACAPNSETLFLTESTLSELKSRFKKIVVFYDNDLTGIEFMNKIKRNHPELIYTWIPRKFGAKDISDYYKAFGREKTKNLIKSFIKHVL